MGFVNVTAQSASPSAAEVHAALARLVESRPFASAPRLRAFLTFVVTSALAGKSDTLKEYTVGTQALRRPESFDPSIDAIVRVEAGRLRKALALHYEGEGSEDSVLITMPAGGYVPKFALAKSAAPPSSAKCQTSSIAEERRAQIAKFRQGMAEFREGMAELKSTLASSHSIMAQSQIIVARSRGGTPAG
jgi:hypothetical protein